MLQIYIKELICDGFFRTFNISIHYYRTKRGLSGGILHFFYTFANCLMSMV